MFSQYTSRLASKLCGGSSRKLIAGWWYVDGSRRMNIFTWHSLSHYRQVFDIGHNSRIHNPVVCLDPITVDPGECHECVGGALVVRLQYWWDHDYEEIS
jgi:hypothetical protein